MKPLHALAKALRKHRPDVLIEPYGEGTAIRIALTEGGPRMVIRPDYFEDIHSDPERLSDYADLILRKLEQEAT